MTIKPKLTSIYLALAAAAGFVLSPVSSQAANSAIATISSALVPGGYNYTITLTDTGSSSLNSFWYGWTIFGNNLPSNPTTAGNSLGWANTLDLNSIMWQNSTGTALAPGQSGTFTFFSTSAPGAITTSPSGESVAYTGVITASQGAADSTPAFSPVLVATPEPSSLAMMAVGSLGLLGAGWRKFRKQS